MEKTKLALSYLFRLALAGFFIYAGASKLTSPGLFFEEIEAYRLLSGKAAFLAAYYLPPLEICAGLALFARPTLKGGSLIIFLLNIVFILAISSAWIRGLDISCGCFGGEGEVVDDYSIYYLKIILRDLGFALMALFLYAWPEGKQ